MLQWILPWMAGDEAKGDLLADSSGYSMGQYEEWTNAKYGSISVRQFCKIHIIHTPHGKICAAVVTPGHVHDSPQLRKMTQFLPHGSGHLMADSAYIGKKNCPSSVKDYRAKADNAAKVKHPWKGIQRTLRYGEVLQGTVPGTFYRLVGIRNNVESAFCVPCKERFGAVVRAVRERAQSIELLSMAICYNMVA